MTRQEALDAISLCLANVHKMSRQELWQLDEIYRQLQPVDAAPDAAQVATLQRAVQRYVP